MAKSLLLGLAKSREYLIQIARIPAQGNKCRVLRAPRQGAGL